MRYTVSDKKRSERTDCKCYALPVSCSLPCCNHEVVLQDLIQPAAYKFATVVSFLEMFDGVSRKLFLIELLYNITENPCIKK